MPKILGNFISLWIWFIQVAHTKSRSKRYGEASKGPINQTFGKDHHRYVHGLRTKEVIAIRNLLAEIGQAPIKVDLF